MKRTTFGKAAVASLLVATTMVGCNGAAFRPNTAAVVPEKEAHKLAARAEKALAARDAAGAVDAAEAAVRAAPDNAAYRQILGRAYVAGGRFASAETSLTDAMTLGNGDSRTIISLALVQVGLGKNDAARALLAANMDKVPAADYGLALAMAGDAEEGVRILSEAIHDPSASARTRQNLAYAYALAGRWKDARVLAGEDLDPLAANQRIAQWAMMADPALAPQRVAVLMGVTIDAADAGMPAALALAPSGSAVALAEAGPAIPPAPPIDATYTASGPQTVVADPAPPIAPAITETAAPVPVIRASERPVRSAAASKTRPDFITEGRGAKPARALVIAPVATKPAARIQQVALIRPVTGNASNWVVQLGAYESAAIAKEKWMSMARVNGTLAGFPVLTSQVTVKGKPFHRLAISGFSSRADAATLCHSVQAQRGKCFVRESAPGATPQRWAVATKGRQFASR
ncbi:SPOR domain-containing protein [Sphingobium sp. AN558]|uniref:SPOR domain-containing protein n=1 Tax=Sphingobium sp. AN558 TaxID=3133442 RepID=UPI0030BA9D75